MDRPLATARGRKPQHQKKQRQKLKSAASAANRLVTKPQSRKDRKTALAAAASAVLRAFRDWGFVTNRLAAEAALLSFWRCFFWCWGLRPRGTDSGLSISNCWGEHSSVEAVMSPVRSRFRGGWREDLR